MSFKNINNQPKIKKICILLPLCLVLVIGMFNIRTTKAEEVYDFDQVDEILWNDYGCVLNKYEQVENYTVINNLGYVNNDYVYSNDYVGYAKYYRIVFQGEGITKDTIEAKFQNRFTNDSIDNYYLDTFCTNNDNGTTTYEMYLFPKSNNFLIFYINDSKLYSSSMNSFVGNTIFLGNNISNKSISITMNGREFTYNNILEFVDTDGNELQTLNANETWASDNNYLVEKVERTDKEKYKITLKKLGETIASDDHEKLTLSNEGTLTISGEGKIDCNFNQGDGSYIPDNLSDAVKKLVIDEGITNYSLSGSFKNITAVTLPSTFEEINEGMFSSCTKLKSIDIPESVTKIGYWAFSGSGITEITIPESVTRIDSGAFSNCDSLEKITFKGNYPDKGIASDAFDGVKAKVYYPSDDSTYTVANKTTYGGNLTWIESSKDDEDGTGGDEEDEYDEESEHVHDYQSSYDAKNGITTYTCSINPDHTYTVEDARTSDSNVTLSSSSIKSLTKYVANKYSKANNPDENYNIQFEYEDLDVDSSSNEAKEIKKVMISKDKVVGYVDLSIIVESSERVNITDLDTPITITLNVPSTNDKYDSYYVVRYHDDKAEVLETTYNENKNTVTFSSSKFSTYAIVGHNHDYETVVTKKATCGKTGTQADYCKLGLDSCPVINQKTIAATGLHTWNEGIITTNPTTSKQGVKTYTCTVCGDTKTEMIDKLSASTTSANAGSKQTQNNPVNTGELYTINYPVMFLCIGDLILICILLIKWRMDLLYK